jgi:hypothetical protein
VGWFGTRPKVALVRVTVGDRSVQHRASGPGCTTWATPAPAARADLPSAIQIELLEGEGALDFIEFDATSPPD